MANFQGEVVSDLSSFACRRIGGSRIKHRVKQNWLKMYDKGGLVLRIETVINNPEEFRVRKQVLRDGKQRTEWVALRKGVAYLFRYREISLQANARYLDALAAVDDPTAGKKALQRLTTTKKDAAGRSCPGFNPMAQHDAALFKSLMTGEHCLHGFTNRDIRSRLTGTRWLRARVPTTRRRPAPRSAAASGGCTRTGSSPRSRAPGAGASPTTGARSWAPPCTCVSTTSRTSTPASCTELLREIQGSHSKRTNLSLVPPTGIEPVSGA